MRYEPPKDEGKVTVIADSEPDGLVALYLFAGKHRRGDLGYYLRKFGKEQGRKVVVKEIGVERSR